jgi:glycosyltransferase involved in cell wall biosynthesis
LSDFSIAILTLNEEQTLGPCLDSVSWADDILIFDSFSTDRTTEIARARGARVIQHEFSGYARQRRACLEKGEFKHPWVFMLDADERFTPELRQEIQAALPRISEDVCLFRLRRKDFFLGKWIRRSTLYPTWFGRLMRRNRVRIDREINEQYSSDGQVQDLSEHLLHEPFAKGLSHWIERHNTYSTLEAEQRLSEQDQAVPAHQLFSSDAVLRRSALKQLAYRVPGRPLWMLLYLWFGRGAILEGYPGVCYSALRAWYELTIDLKSRELRMKTSAPKR